MGGSRATMNVLTKALRVLCFSTQEPATSAQSNIMRIMRPLSKPACFGQQQEPLSGRNVFNGVAMAKRLWSKVPTTIIDDPAWGVLSDREWREKFTAIVNDPANIHCEYDHPEYRADYKKKRSWLKRLLFSRDPNKCATCGSTRNLEIDHIIPLARGGDNDPKNLQILCRTCNRKKWANI